LTSSHYLLDIVVIELGDDGLAILLLNRHVLCELFVAESKGCENFERGRSHTSLVGRSILEDNHTAVFEHESSLLSEEEIRSFDHKLVARKDLVVRSLAEELVNIRELNSLRTSYIERVSGLRLTRQVVYAQTNLHKERNKWQS